MIDNKSDLAAANHSPQGKGISNLYIVDNSSEQASVGQYLAEWCGMSKQMDIATGYLEIGGLLTLDTNWQKLDKIRIILGDEVTKRTCEVLKGAAAPFLAQMKDSLNAEQEKNDFLLGVPAIAAALKSRKIECRVFDRGKFHAKAYITYFRDETKSAFPKAMHVPDGYALVGSSNFTAAGLTRNVELNVQIKDNVDELQSWFEARWNESTDITDAILKIVEDQTREFSPYDVYLRSMYEFFKGRESTVAEWEETDSKVFPELSRYQIDGYHSLVDIAEKYFGAFLCDGVGLGKTFIGLMLIERYVKQERRNVVLVVPAAARKSVWETTITKYIPDLLDGFFPFRIVNHTDLIRDKMQNLMGQIASHGEVVIIDEAHHFRNRDSKAYRKFFDMMAEGPRKKMFMLTATPINNSFLDLQHLIELFSHRQDDYFASLGINSVIGHFRVLEKSLDGQCADDSDATRQAFASDPLVKELVVQRSRVYVKQSLSAEEGAKVLFPAQKTPVVANYSLRRTCGDLLDHFTALFDRRNARGESIPILSLAVYSPYEKAYYVGDPGKVDPMKVGRQNQIVALIRQLLLKRFESSVAAFQDTCVRIYYRLKAFLVDYRDKKAHLVDKTLAQQADVIDFVEKYIKDNLITADEDVNDFDDDLPDYVWEVENNNLNEDDFDIGTMLEDTVLDLNNLSQLIRDMIGFDPSKDDKLNILKKNLSEDVRLAGRKLLIFTEYRATAKYLERELKRAGFQGLFEIDGQSNVDRHEMVRRFSPYYNDATSGDVGDKEIRTLIATDVLSEGLNLQDASRLINYELHWNPVRLMQRIGRVDRRRSASVEAKLLADHPEIAADRDKVFYWNFLPPAELEKLLALYKTVARKTLRISKMFGIEGKQLLTPEDDYKALEDFNAQYEGHPSSAEEMALAYQQLMKDNTGYAETVKSLPAKMYSGKAATTAKGIFFCYSLPVKKMDGTMDSERGVCRWFLYDPESKKVTEETAAIWQAIRCEKTQPRALTLADADFQSIRKTIEHHIRNSYFRRIQAPLGAVLRLVTWMQLV
jgi:superfamily II DNA or RNA helicase